MKGKGPLINLLSPVRSLYMMHYMEWINELINKRLVFFTISFLLSLTFVNEGIIK